SSSKGNAVLVSNGKTNILIDCGISKRRTADALAQAGVSPRDLDAILVTHEHNDHISGVGVMSRGYDIPVYANEKTWAAMERALGRVEEANKKLFRVGESFEINGVGVTSFAIPHDAACPVGYSLFTEGLKLSVATDMGHIDESVVDSICGSDIVLLEANHDLAMLQNGRYPAALKRRILGQFGHLSNDSSAQIAVRLLRSGTRAILLGHLSEENNLPDLAYAAVKGALTGAGARLERDIRLAVANRYELSGMF
ncbi:MAG TPA: MBL fold metallo-hydrolase, partial [Candidatus Aphodoplasma excrementigallinarum]|nr:MBL fold metallo-hydrolase [Candidatus Aphodoplasma excrementigallinarum]